MMVLLSIGLNNRFLFVQVVPAIRAFAVQVEPFLDALFVEIVAMLLHRV